MECENTIRSLSFGIATEPSPYLHDGALGGEYLAGNHGTWNAVQRRDFYTCQFCGFISEKYQCCIGPGSEHPDDLMTVCPFCEQVLNVELVGQQKSGTLIHLPDVSQASINRWMPEVYAAGVGRGQHRERAKDLLKRLLKRSKFVKARTGFKTADQLVQALRETQEPDALAQDVITKGLRVLPLDKRIRRSGEIEYNQFPQILAYWRSAGGPLSTTRSKGFQDFELDLVSM